MRTTHEAWIVEQRPIYSRLPGINGRYQTEEKGNTADWLTVYFDELLIATKANVDDLPRQLNPSTCDAVPWLDFLAELCGYRGEYWDKAWPVPVKRSLLQNAFTLVWANKGSRAVIDFVLDLFAIAHDIWLGDGFLAGITTLPGTVGAPEWRYYIRLPLQYLRNGSEFKLAEKINRLYGPVFCDSRVAYKQFYAGFSVAGDPVFTAESP